MLIELRAALKQRGIDFRVARDIGQFHDTLERTGDSADLEIDRTIDEALTA